MRVCACFLLPAIFTDLYNDLLNLPGVGPGVEQKLGSLRNNIAMVCFVFAGELEPLLQKALQKCPLSFGLMDKILFPNQVFNSPWVSKVNKPAPVVTKTTPTTTISNTLPYVNSNNENQPAQPQLLQNNKRPTTSTNKPKQKRTKWTDEENEVFDRSLEKRGTKDLLGIALDTGKTKAEVRSHLNSRRLGERRNQLAPTTAE